MSDPAAVDTIQRAFAELPALYIADGHHRSAAASRVADHRKRAELTQALLAERVGVATALRVAALGRKNFLFVGTDEAGENLAGLNSLIATCEASGVNPVDFADILVRVQSHPASRIDELLPHNWSAPPAPS